MTITRVLGSYDILTLPPDLDKESTQQQYVVDMDVFSVDNDAQRQKSRVATPNFQRTIGFFFPTRDAFAEMEVFLGQRAGKAYPFWLPTWNDDMTVLLGGFFDFLITDIGYTEQLSTLPEFQKGILIVNKTDSYDMWHRAVDSAVDVGDGTERLSGLVDFPYPLGFANATSSTHRFMFYHLVRLDSDDVEIEYLDGEKVQVTFPVYHVPEG